MQDELNNTDLNAQLNWQLWEHLDFWVTTRLWGQLRGQLNEQLHRQLGGELEPQIRTQLECSTN
jgi:hypothetical protein